MTDTNQKQLGSTLWGIADQLRGAMDADDFRDYMLSFLFLRYLSDNYETASKKELGKDYPEWLELPAPMTEKEGSRMLPPLSVWYANNPDDLAEFETPCKRASNTSRTTPSKAPFRGCSQRSIWLPTSWAGPTPTATPSSAPSSKRSRKAWPSSPPTPTRWATPTNT